MAKKKKVEVKKLTLEQLQKSRVKPKPISGVISTGSLAVDKGSGINGLPKGRIVEMFGPESSGKSTVAMMTCAESLRNGGRVGYIDGEYAFDPVYANTLGMDTESENCYVYRPKDLEDCLNQGVLWAKSELFDVIVIDSLSGPAPNAEHTGKIGEHKMTIKARQVAEFCRIVTPSISTGDTLLIVVGQLRDKIGGYMTGETTDYGNAMKFYASIRLRISREVSKDKQTAKTKVNYKKNKVGKPFVETSFQLIHGVGIDKAAETYDVGLILDILTKQGNTAFYGETKLGGSRDKSIQVLRDNIEMADIIQKEIMTSEKIIVEPKEEEDDNTKK